MMDKNEIQNFIAKRTAQELQDGDLVNLGIGLPTRVSNYIPEGVQVILHSENGFVGLGPAPVSGAEDPHIVNAGGQFASILPGGMFFDSATSFGIIRGGHLAATVLGALQVDSLGNIANYMIPGKMVPGMGGAMDLVSGAKRVIVAMEHSNKGTPKILDRCTLPLTAVKVVDTIITEMCVFKVTSTGLLLTELNPEYSLTDLRAATGAEFAVSADLREMVV